MARKNLNLVLVTLADLMLFGGAAVSVAMDHQKSTLQHIAARNERERDVAVAERDAALRDLARLKALALPNDRVVSQQLLGLQGNLERLVFVVDKSGSMGRGRRWEYIQGVIDTWLRYLPVEKCALVVFDDKVEAYPAAGGFLDVSGPDGVQNRNALLALLAELKPGGNTNTLGALERAYSLAPTAIILASDGLPDKGANRFDAPMADAVVELCRRHGHSVPVHVLALGNYFHPKLGQFLWSIADASGGSFLAR